MCPVSFYGFRRSSYVSIFGLFGLSPIERQFRRMRVTNMSWVLLPPSTPNGFLAGFQRCWILCRCAVSISLYEVNFVVNAEPLTYFLPTKNSLLFFSYSSVGS